jgi:DNA-binding response OmpR family regulator
LAARSARDRATTLPRSAPVPRRATRASAWSKYTLDLPKRQLLDPIGKDVALTSGEFDILKTFAENPNRPLSRDWLLETTSHRSRDPFDRAIDLRITRIRRKIEPTPDKPTVIRTARRIG